MKQKLMIFLGAFLLVACLIFGIKPAIVNAAGDFTNPELKVTEVEDIGAYNDYVTNNLMINNALVYQGDSTDGCQVYKFSIAADGFVTYKLSCRNVTKVTQVSGRAGSTISGATMTTTIYRDAGLLYPVSPVITEKSEIDPDLTQKIALDKGSYYLAVKTDKYSTTVSGTTTLNMVSGTAQLIIYYQPVGCDEQYRPSMVGQENPLDMETTFKGILTSPNPKDYYTFELTEKAMVKINCMYSSTNPALFTLYSPEREALLTKSITGGSVWYNVEKYLEPGTYYCSLETTKQFDGGTTSILVDPTFYPLTLEQVNQTKDSYVTVATIDDPSEIRWVLGKLTNSELNSTKWNKGNVITDALQFGVNKVGYYTVRVTDQYGNMFMQSIRVTSCDQKAPDAPKFKTCTVDTFVVTGTAEKNSLVTVYVNGKAFTCVTSAKGNFSCTLPSKLVKGSFIEATAQDVSGNISEKAELILE